MKFCIQKYGPILGCAIAFFSAACGNPQAPKTPAAPISVPASSGPLKPNVLFVVADTLRADRLDMSRNGVPIMPNLSAFAAASWNFTRCTAQATWTKPSMTSIFTSLYPDVHHVLFGPFEKTANGQSNRADAVPSDIEMLATYLKLQGYATAGIQSNVNLHSEFGFGQGFDSYYINDYPAFTANLVTDQALTMIDKMQPPFLCYAQYMDAHAPYGPPAAHTGAFGPQPELTESDRVLLKDYFGFYSDKVDFEVGIASQRKLGDLSKGGEEHIRYMYDGGVHFLDAECMRLIESVTKKHPNTIVVFTSDHGEELFEHGSVGHGKTVYEELSHVPLLIHSPNSAAKSVGARVESIDILPTLAGLLGTPARATWQGRDLAANIDSLATDTPVYTTTRTSKPISKVDLEGIVVGDTKLIRDNLTTTNRLFDLATDPGELHILTDRQDAIARLGNMLDEHLENCKKHPLARSAPESILIDEEMARRIAGVGYGGRK